MELTVDFKTRNITCVRCKMVKHEDSFGVRRERLVIPRKTLCKPCESVVSSARQRGELNKAKATNRRKDNDSKSGYMRRYGITRDDAVAMLAAQGGLCAICKKPGILGYQQMVVDHDHATGKVRAILCQLCNHGLGCFKDNTELMATAISYLGGK